MDMITRTNVDKNKDEAWNNNVTKLSLQGTAASHYGIYNAKNKRQRTLGRLTTFIFMSFVLLKVLIPFLIHYFIHGNSHFFSILNLYKGAFV